jgi:hypothetical protein
MATAGKTLVAIQSFAALFSLMIPQQAFTYDHPLTDEAVREAYFLGQDKLNVNGFFAQYTQELPLPESGPQVAEVEVNTPYAQVVDASAQHATGYSAEQAAEDYRKRGDTIVVRVKVLFTPTYSDDGDYWRRVSVTLIQKGKGTSAIGVTGEPIESADTYSGTTPIGALVYATFSVKGVGDGALQVDIGPAGGAHVQAKFDLSSIR